MTQRTMRAAALALLLGLAAGSRGALAVSAQEMSPAEAAAIRKGVQAALDSYRELAAAGRWEALMGLYADDPRFRWVANGTIEARSVAEIRKYFSGLPATARVETTYEGTEVTVLAPDIALVQTLFQTRLVDPKGGGFSFGGALTMTMVERGGSWKILTGHSSGRQAPAAVGSRSAPPSS